MIFIGYTCLPNKNHPEFEDVGEIFVNCWIKARSFKEAKSISKNNLVSEKWKILSLDTVWKIPKGFYNPKDEDFIYFQQALVDKEVYVLHQSPKYPVYYVEFDVAPMKINKHFPSDACAVAKYLVVNEFISKTSDMYDNFWQKLKHQRKAVRCGKDLIKKEKWRIMSVRNEKPVNSFLFGNDSKMSQYYNEAEEYGECLAFYHSAS